MNASFTLTLFMKWTHPSHSIAFCRVRKLPSVGKVFTQNVWMDRRKDVVRRGDAALERVGLYTYQTSKLKDPVGDRTHDHSIARSLRGNFRRDENSTRYLISAPGLFFGWTVKHLIDANFNELWFPLLVREQGCTNLWQRRCGGDVSFFWFISGELHLTTQTVLIVGVFFLPSFTSAIISIITLQANDLVKFVF